MFTAKTPRIQKLSELFPGVIAELEVVFNQKTKMYIDWSNVIHWQDKLSWHFNIKRMKQFFDSFDTIESVKIYTGTLEGNKKSEEAIIELQGLGYEVITKPVKHIRISVDASSVADNSPALLAQFIKKPLLQHFDIATVTLLNQKLRELNQRGIFYIEDMKCNFDVEMGRDMLRDFELDHVQNYILWSVDSDFADPVNQIKADGKKPVVFATSGKVSPELAETGVYIFDIRKIKEFICWPREIPAEISSQLTGI